MSENFDVIIVGAGPAGSCAARKMAEAGLSVMVYDRRAELGTPVRCGEGINGNAEEVIGNIPHRAICARIIGGRIYAPNGRMLEADVTKTGQKGGYVLDRKVFDKWLAREAARAGAFIQANTLVTDLLIENGRIAGVRGKRWGDPFEAKAKVVVCATGAESRLGAQSGLKTHCSMQLVDTCIQYEMSDIDIEGQSDWEKFLHIWVGNKLAPRGYYWVFPKGDRSANVGIGIVPSNEREKSALYYHEKFLDSHPGLRNGRILEVKGGVVPVGGLMQDMVVDNFVLCGEAAHHVNAIHGGGIKEAIFSGRIAADVIIDCMQRNDLSKSALSMFNLRWWEERGRRLRSVEKVREVFEKMTDDDFNMLADAITAEDVFDLARGEKLSVLAKALMKKPGLLGLARHLL
ncbi:MAG: NAD(P)/FAD-dependent oxidoreductase [Candidatus Aenigmatarchaeota archaeon]